MKIHPGDAGNLKRIYCVYVKKESAVKFLSCCCAEYASGCSGHEDINRSTNAD